MKQELKDALAFIDFDPQDPNQSGKWDWVPLAGAMIPHCREHESINHAAARIGTAAYRELLAKLESIEKP